ncbi:MAG: hypothetical protein JXR03_04235 [Cyclobacteriaceae bacterium]
MKLLIDVLGWIGSVEVILAYFLISYKKVDSDSRLYQLLNLTGAIFLIVNTIYYGAYPSTFINIVWVGIAVFALAKMVRSK